MKQSPAWESCNFFPVAHEGRGGGEPGEAQDEASSDAWLCRLSPVFTALKWRSLVCKHTRVSGEIKGLWAQGETLP